MEQQIRTEQINQVPADIQLFKQIAKIGDFEISLCKKEMNLEDKSSYRKLELTAAQKIQISGLLQHLPQAATAGMMAQAYTVRFPEGLPHTLTALKQGGFGSMIHGGSGSFVGSASFYSMSAQAAVMGVFTAMSAATGQYFLKQINGNLREINQKIDTILEFLYGDKKAELLSEISFTQYAYQNYSSIMMHEQQQTAMIASLQEARKVAIKDIEFYLRDLNSIVDKKRGKDALSRSNMVFDCKRCLDLSLQLYVMCGILEAYYSQNFDVSYYKYQKNDMSIFVNKSNGHLQSVLGELRGQLKAEKDSVLKKFDKFVCDKYDTKMQEVSDLIDLLVSGEKSDDMYAAIDYAFQGQTKAETYFLDNDGNAYCANSQ